MNKQYFSIILLFICSIGYSQNYIPNGDFEQYTNCPSNHSEFQGFVDNWTNPQIGSGNGSPDYYNPCATGNVMGVPSNQGGWQEALSGASYSGMVIAREQSNTNFREYSQIMLTAPLVANECYHFEMYINLSNQSKFNSDDIGVYFSNIAITNVSTVGPLPYTPQITNTPGNYPDTSSWTKVEGDYTAIGNESYLLIGNFKNSVNTNTIINDSLATKPIAYVYIDSVSLVNCTTTINVKKLSKVSTDVFVFPNPATDKLNISINNGESSEISIYNITSRRLLHENFTSSISLNIESLAKGVYIYEIRNNGKIVKNGKVIKN